MNLFTVTFQSDLLLRDLHREALHSFPINPYKGQTWQMEYFFLFTTPTSLFPQGQCSLFMLHYRIHFKGTIVASKPIKPLWLVSDFQRIIGHDWPLPLILHLHFQIGHHWSCSTKLDLVLELVSTSPGYHRKVLTQVPAVDVHPVFLVSSSCSRLVMNG